MRREGFQGFEVEVLGLSTRHQQYGVKQTVHNNSGLCADPENPACDKLRAAMHAFNLPDQKNLSVAGQPYPKTEVKREYLEDHGTQ